MSKSNMNPAITRRNFIASASAASGSLVLSFHVPFAQAQEAKPEINAWVVVKPDDSVVIRIARAEMGQGTLTGLAQMVAEELECNWAKVSTEHPTPGQTLARKRVWGNFNPTGSRGIRESNDYLRKGGAAARMMLVQAAAEAWGVPAAECVAANSIITHKASGRKTSYGKVAEAAARITPPEAASIVLKDPKNWRLIGKRMARLDTAGKTTGAQNYGVDFKLPGLLNAAIRDCPVFGGTVKSFNAAAVEGRPGVRQVVQVGTSAVAVVADTWWRAKAAVEALPIDWDLGPNSQVSSNSIREILKAGLDAKEAVVGSSKGDAPAVLASASRKIEAVYSYPLLSHAPLEPMNATARWTPERCEVWAPTQNAEATLAATVEASGLAATKCDVYQLYLGGGFGRRARNDFVTQAVLIAKALPGIPIKLIWSREEDMTHGFFHPVTQCKLSAALDEKGNVSAMHMRISGQSILATVAPHVIKNGKDPVVFQGLEPSGNREGALGYDFPNLLIDHAMRNPHVPAGFWRGVNLNQNAIYMECFIDELAHAAGQDPLAFRRKLMANSPQHLAVLNAVAKNAGWDKPAPKGVFRGLAQTMGFGSYVAACAEVSVSNDGWLKIHRIVAATDPGHAVNIQQIEAQVEGSFVYGLSAALYGEITVSNGAVMQKNFDTYPVMRLHEMPKVETTVLSSGGFWGGVGEPTIAVAAPAVLNAIFAATGKRIRDLPLKHHSLKRT
ncbi:MAG: molybdopterin cofactor-binding domain-containing protein [Hylemonella sp.]